MGLGLEGGCVRGGIRKRIRRAKTVEIRLKRFPESLAVVGWLLISALVLFGCEEAESPMGASTPSASTTLSNTPLAIQKLKPGHYAGKNIVIVSVDTLRADHLKLYGYGRDTSPRLDQIAKQSITFERARAPRGLTWPSLVAMFTSLYPKSSNVRSNGDLLAEDVPTLASLLETHGYATAAFLGNACGVFTRNFDPSFCGTDEAVQEKAVTWIDQHDGSPFFLWVHYKAPHEEYLPPAKYDLFTEPNYSGPANGKREYLDEVILSEKVPEASDLSHVVNLYDGEVLYSDALMGEVWDALSKRGFLDDTIFVFTSDHGEELLQHNNYYYHSCSVYDAVLHIPLVIRFPDRAGGGMRVPQLVQNIDIAPTLLELVGVDRPAGFEGQSLRPLINGEPGANENFTRSFAEYHRRDVGWIGMIRTDRWHYVYNPEEITPVCRPKGDHFEVSRTELYDHAKDSREEHNVAIEHADLIADLQRELLEAFGRQSDYEPAERADLRVIEQLKAMGYLVQ